MAGLVAQITRLRALRAVPGNVSGPLTVVASVVCHAVHASGLGTTPGNMAGFSAVVAGRHIGALHAVLGEVALAVAAVATRRVLLAISGIVANLIAFVALLATAITAAAAVTASRLGAFPREMTRLVTFVTSASRTHF